MYSYLANIKTTRETLDAFGLSLKYKLGQNFLVSDAIIGKILQLADVDGSSEVLEVGPGIGTLTCALLPKAARVVSIEADRDLPPVLAQTLATWRDRFALIEGDALKVDAALIRKVFDDMGAANAAPTHFIANLPYQVAATLILKYFQELPSLRVACVMVQAEVADRICAAPGSKTYGAYTAKLAQVAKPAGRFQVAPDNFCPPPHVMSSVIRLERISEADADTAHVSKVIDAAFAQRRKTIRNSMRASGFDAAALDAAFDAVGIAPTARAETLDPEMLRSLARELS